MSIPPASKQPEAVEAELGVREYWFETHRRLIIIPDGDEAVVSIDVYAEVPCPPGEPVLEAGGARLHYVPLEGIKAPPGLEVRESLLTILETLEGCEAVNVRLRAAAGKISREQALALYRSAVLVVERRDPFESPLPSPPLVARVYEARTARRRRRR